jgi:anti-anti-sigma regulatory factor
MLRITSLSADSTEVTLKLEGQIAAEWVIELERVCRELLVRYPVVRLDFQQVTFIDSSGARMFKRLPADRLNIVNCSTLIGEVLEIARSQARAQATER